MEVASQSGYMEEVPMYDLAPDQYLAAARNAALLLHWFPVSAQSNSITCYTRPDYITGEVVTITVNNKTATIHSTNANEYNPDEAQNRNNAVLFAQAMAQVVAALEKADRNLHPMHREKYGALLPSRSYLVTPLLVYANVLVYVAMVITGIDALHPTAKSLFLWGGNLRPAIADGQWWRLLSYMFLHGGAMHLIMNMFALLYIGMFLEPLLGKFRFTAAYLLTGVCAGLLSITFHANSVGVGASGAIFGMYGVFLSMLTTNHIQRTLRKTMLRSILFFVLLNLLYGMEGNVDNAAHIGGLVSGLAIGYAYYPGIAKKASLKAQLLVTALSGVAVVILVAFVVSRL
jgi:rhomboid protease GluP